jgi:hypothetical protein
MGLLDHRRSWHIDTRLSPDECAKTFADVLGGSSDLGLVRARWRLRVDAGGHSARVVATYDGRGWPSDDADDPAGAGLRGLAAIGSQITFEARRPVPGGGTRCSMWLSRSCRTRLMLTPEARFFRRYMRRVVRALASADPDLEVRKR